MPKVQIILQARLNSSRLPGKMLMPMAGLPLVVLCAKRAQTSGHPVMVATSEEPSDDALVSCLNSHDIQHMRGSLDDVLARFIKATAELSDEDLVVRLTGDNPFVDGEFVNALIDFHQQSEHDYVRTLSPDDGLPYGVSAEVLTAGALRKIDALDVPEEDREHVTSYLTKAEEYDLFHSPLDKDLSHLRATVDTYDDYLRAANIFDHLQEDPLTISWQDLVVKLEQQPEAPPPQERKAKAQNKLALGTVQLGLDYGVSNKTGQPSHGEAADILQTAVSKGVHFIDTAAAYGTSEQVVGACLGAQQRQELNIYTKLDPLAHFEEGTSTEEIIDAVEASVKKSLYNLGLQTLPCLMLHRWDHYTQFGQKIWTHLQVLKKQGLIEKLGVSVQSPQEALEALQEDEIEFMQLPFNICDWRWRESGFITARAQRPDMHIQVRSSLLQGVFLLPPDKWPVLPEEEAGDIAKTLKVLVKDLGQESVQDLCYAYARSAQWVDSVVVGVETRAHLEENIKLFNKPLLDNIAQIDDQMPQMDERFLNPAMWPKPQPNKSNKKVA